MPVKPDPWKMLSPSTRQTLSEPMNRSPIRKAWASPSGEGCSAYSNRTPKSEPSPSRRLKPGRSTGVEMIRISRIPASISTEMG